MDKMLKNLRVDNMMKRISEKVTKAVVSICATKFGFNEEDALLTVRSSMTKKRKKEEYLNLIEKRVKKTPLSDVSKVMISRQIKPLTLTDAKNDFNELKLVGSSVEKLSPRCQIGNSTVDFFTFTERLNTKGKYDTSFYEFVVDLDVFKKKQFIANMLSYYETDKNKNKTKNYYVVLKEVYNICISAINIFRPLIAMEVYSKYKPTAVLDFTCGWGGRLVGACAFNVPSYVGIDINKNLKIPYDELTHFLSDLSSTKVKMYFEDAVHFDYSCISYDMVLTSPPYFFLEKYSNNLDYENSKKEMIDRFYTPVISATYKYLQKGGHYCLNVNREIYEKVCKKILGQATETIPFKKSKRQNEYGEFIYVWKKQ
jgi:hypothetical protein